MAASTAAPRRNRTQPATHPTVWIGLLLAIVGLLFAVYSYTGTRIYDITFALVAAVGGVLALIGILTSAWGRAIMATRAQRARRGFARPPAEAAVAAEDAPAAKERRSFLGAWRRKSAEAEDAPPTIAEPAAKRRRIAMPALPKLGRRKAATQESTNGDDPSIFAFRRRAADATGGNRASLVEDAPAAAPGALMRITLKCPQCSTEFSAEGVQPIPIECPSCGLRGTA